MLLNPLADFQQLAATPTTKDGLSYHLEIELRALGCQIIQQVGVLLRLPQRTMAVAQVFFQRFWFTSSMCDFSASEVAMGALLLSTKLEETQISLRLLINAFHFVEFHVRKRHPFPHEATVNDHCSETETGFPHEKSSTKSTSATYHAPAYDSDELSRLRDAVVVSEMQILKRLGFHVQVTLPYALLANYLQALGLANPDLKVNIKTRHSGRSASSIPPLFNSPAPERVSLAQCAWSFLNDA